MGILRATVSLRAESGVPEDVAQNVWHFTAPSPEEDFLVALNGATNGGLGGFYATIGNNFGRSMSGATNAHQIDWALVTPGGAGPDDDTVSAIIATENFTVTVDSDGKPMPAEVAVCMSFNGSIAGIPVTSGVTRPRSRRTGRIYLPHIDDEAAEWGSVDFNTRPTAAFQTAIINAAQDLKDDVDEAGGVWVVYSRASGVTHPVVEVWVDNAFDTQRRRGVAATTRTTHTLT